MDHFAAALLQLLVRRLSVILAELCMSIQGVSIYPPEDDGRDKMHWFIHTREPKGSREDKVASYINLVASVLGSEDKAKKAMYSVSTN